MDAPTSIGANRDKPEEKPSTENQFENESVVSDRCWAPRYRTDSRKWLLRDGHPESMHAETWSTMKSSYGGPEEDHVLPVLQGKRTRMLLEKMRNEAINEAVAERVPKPTIEEYMTTYDDTFCSPDPTFEAKEPPRKRELYEKYPLYDNPAATYWRLQHAQHIAERPAVGGAMKTVNFSEPFKRNSHFSTPIEELMDGGQVDR